MQKNLHTQQTELNDERIFSTMIYAFRHTDIKKSIIAFIR